MMKAANKKNLQDFEINIKFKLAALWTAVTFCYLYGDYFELYTPGKVDNLLSGENVLDSPSSLLIASAILVIPPIMILVSLMARPTLSKVLNIIFGTLFTLMMALIAIGSLTPWYSFYVLLAIVEAILTFMIVWKAIKWPRIVV